MKKSILAASIFVSLIITEALFAQEQYSIQINGGIIAPWNSSNGLSDLVQFNYSLNPSISLYVYSGYSTWDRYKVTFLENYSSVQKNTRFNSYTSDDHTLIPLYFGGQIDLYTNDLFTSYISIEVGYSYFTYNSYKNWKSVNPETGEVVGYYADNSTRKANKENLFGVGIGTGLSHRMSENLSIVLSYKLNSHVNSNYHGLFNNKATYSLFLAGFTFNI